MAQQPQSIDDAKYTVVSQGVAAQNPQPQITIDQSKFNAISQGVATNSFIPQELAYPKQQSTVSANAGQDYVNATNASILGAIQPSARTAASDQATTAAQNQVASQSSPQ